MQPRRHNAALFNDSDPRRPYDSLAALGWALVPWAVLAILVLIAKHYGDTHWFFGS